MVRGVTELVVRELRLRTFHDLTPVRRGPPPRAVESEAGTVGSSPDQIKPAGRLVARHSRRRVGKSVDL